MNSDDDEECFEFARRVSESETGRSFRRYVLGLFGDASLEEIRLRAAVAGDSAMSMMADNEMSEIQDPAFSK